MGPLGHPIISRLLNSSHFCGIIKCTDDVMSFEAPPGPGSLQLSGPSSFINQKERILLCKSSFPLLSNPQGRFMQKNSKK